MGFNSFLRFLFAFPLETLATCLAFWMAACLICEPFMVETDVVLAWEVGWRGGRSRCLLLPLYLQERGSALLLLLLLPLLLVPARSC